MSRKGPIAFRLKPTLLEELRRRALSSGISQAVIVETALERFFKRKKE